jgi:hypothetical protein
MLDKITSTVFNAGVFAVAIGATVWLTVTGHALQVEGLLLAMGAILAAVIFGFRLNEGSDNEHPSIWIGPLGSLRSANGTVGKPVPSRPVA